MNRCLAILCAVCALYAASVARADEDHAAAHLADGTLHSPHIHHRRPRAAMTDPDAGFSVGVGSDFRSRYVSHALADSDGWVWQPSATVEWRGLGFNVWGNFVLDDIPDQGRFNEIDLTLYYDYRIAGFTIHPYVASYLFPTSNERSLDYSSTSELLPSIHIAYSLAWLDIFADAQFYAHPRPGAVRAEFGLGLSHELPLSFGIRTAAILGFGNSRYNRSVFSIDKNAFNYFTYTIAFPWSPLNGFTVEPNAHVSTFLSQEFRDATQFPVLVWGGLDFSYDL